MAHRTDVVQVQKDIADPASSQIVTDPVCGMKLKKKDAKSVLFQGSETIYFCSKECRERYLSAKYKKQAA